MILHPETKTFTKMGFRILRPLFPLGDVYLSAGAAAFELDPAVIDRLLTRLLHDEGAVQEEWRLLRHGGGVLAGFQP